MDKDAFLLVCFSFFLVPQLLRETAEQLLPESFQRKRQLRGLSSEMADKDSADDLACHLSPEGGKSRPP